MNNEKVKLQALIKHRLVKWEGDPPPDGTEPVGHPQCVEIIEIENGVSRVIYRRSIN